MSDLVGHLPPIALTWDDEAPGRRWRAMDATLVFADISGFTALTERLSARGRIGAEQIIEALNTIFGTMLTAAAQRGGELMKFGGDALFFLFRGPDHTARACDAAVEMRALLRRQRPAPDVGPIRLSMSVGIHSGEVLLLLVGSPTRELLCVGPAATAVTRAEQIAEAGQIVVTEATARRLPATATRQRNGAALLIRRKPSTRADAPLRPGGFAVPGDRLDTLLPRGLGEALAAGAPEPEHRTACVAFVRFSGTDRLLAESGPDAVADAVGEVVTSVQAALAPEGVTLLATDVDADGGKFYLASGVPRASEDDEGRMLRAMRALLDEELPLPVQIGVNRGHVFVAEVGSGFRSAYSAMGDTTNTAARIMGKAPTGHLYAAPVVLDRARTAFEVTPAGPFAMKGKQAPVPVYDVGAERGPHEVGTTSDLPMLGRDAELRAVRTAIAAIGPADGRLITISGPPGSGKSRLLAEALSGTNLRVLQVRGEPYGAASAYRVFRDPVRNLLDLAPGTPADMGAQALAALGRLAPHLLPMAPLLADLLQVAVPATPQADAIDPQFRPDQLASVVIALLEAVRPGPLGIVVEEGHWADAASTALLERLAEATAQHPWLLVVVRRDEGAGFAPAGGARVALGPLPDDVVRELVIAATVATPLRPHDVEAIVDRAAGSPLFVAEVVRTSLNLGEVEALPESIGAVLATQIDQLHPQTRRVLRYSAVLGRSFRRTVLREVLASDGIAVDRATIQDLAGFLDGDGASRYRFRNSLVRDAAYEGLAFRTRARLHARAGAAMERLSTNLDADAATLSLHFEAAGDSPRTLHYARRAADVARRTYANADAAALYQRAVEAARRVPGVCDAERAALLISLGEVRELAGVLDGSIDAYRRAYAATVDPMVRIETLVRRARVLERAGAARAALLAVAHARRLIEAAEAAEADRAHGFAPQLDTLQALIRLGQEKPALARRWAVLAVDGARATGDAEALVQALMAIDYADALLGRTVTGDCTREALQLCIDHGFRPRESVARANLGGYAFYAGRWSEAVQWYTSSREAALAAGNAFGAAETDLALAEILIHQGRAAEAKPMLSDAVRIFGASGMHFERSYGEMLLAMASLALGDAGRAGEMAQRAMTQFQQLGHAVSALEAAMVLAEQQVAQCSPAAALSILDEALAAAKGEAGVLLPRWQLVRAQALRQQGERTAALAAVEAGLLAAREMHLPYDEALLMLLSAELRPGVDAAEQVERARQILDRLGAAGEHAPPGPRHWQDHGAPGRA